MNPYVLAFLAATSFAFGSVLQQKGTFQTRAGEGDPRFLAELFQKRVWLLGGSLQIVGWVLQAAALNTGSLVVVQSICALSLVIALPLGVRFTNQKVGRRSILGAVATLLGIIGFLALGQPQGGISQPAPSTWLAAIGLILAAVLLMGFLARRRKGALSATLFATAAGICYGFQAAVTKVFVTLIGGGVLVLLSSWTTYALILSALAGFAMQQSALKTGHLAPAMAASNAASLTVSVLLGVVLFQETLSKGEARISPALIFLALAVAGVSLLATPEREKAE